MSDYKLKLASTGDFEKIVDLINRNYDGTEVCNKDYLHWEHFDNPDGKAITTIAETDGETAATYTVLPHRYFYEGEILNGNLSVNTLVDKNHRNKNLFRKTSQTTFDTSVLREQFFTVGFPNKSSLNGFKQLGFAHIGNLPLYLHPLTKNIFQLFQLFKRKKEQGNDLELNLKSAFEQKMNSSIETVKSFTDDVAFIQFINAFHESHGITTFRSSAYLNWRFTQIPTRKYSVVLLKRNNALIGYAVLRGRKNFNLNCCWLVDFALLESAHTEETCSFFFSEIKKQLRKNGFHLMACGMSELSHEKKMLLKNSFFKCPEFLLPHPAYFIVKVHRKNHASVSMMDFKNWHLTLGDYDVM